MVAKPSSQDPLKVDCTLMTENPNLGNYFSSEILRADLDESILTVYLHRPERANALNSPLMAELRGLWQRVGTDSAVRVIIVTGAGKSFCAGADMSLLAGDRDYTGADAADELSFLPGGWVGIPVICAVNGACAGGGLHFVADADIVIGSTVATFRDPHVTVGQVSALEPLELAFRVRRDILARMLLLGAHEVVDAQRALSAGLVSEVVPPEALIDRAKELANLIKTGSPEALRRTRAVLRQLDKTIVGSHLDEGWISIQEHWSHPDAQEGPSAAMEKRPPTWKEEG